MTDMYSYPHDTMSGQITLATGDLVTVFHPETRDDIMTGRVVDLNKEWVTVASIEEDSEPRSYKPSTYGFKAAYS